MGSRARVSQAMKPPSRTVPAVSPVRLWALSPAVLAACHQAPDEHPHAGRDQDQARDVEAGLRTAAFGEPEPSADGGDGLTALTAAAIPRYRRLAVHLVDVLHVRRAGRLLSWHLSERRLGVTFGRRRLGRDLPPGRRGGPLAPIEARRR